MEGFSLSLARSSLLFIDEGRCLPLWWRKHFFQGGEEGVVESGGVQGCSTRELANCLGGVEEIESKGKVWGR